MAERPPDIGERRARLEAYWKENQRLIYILTGFPLGYWLSSQFSITVFVILIFVYAIRMNRVIDPKYGFHDEEE